MLANKTKEFSTCTTVSKPHFLHIHASSVKHANLFKQLSQQNAVLSTDLDKLSEVCWSLTHSRKFVMSRLLQLDHATSIASASKLGVITCKTFPSRRLQPIFSVSWYMPKLKSTCQYHQFFTFHLFVMLNSEFAFFYLDIFIVIRKQ
jgi:hypothetical protein